MQNKKVFTIYNFKNMFIDNTVTLKTENSSCKILPSRGALVYSLVLGGQELLFQDKLKETLFSTEKSLRGGIPIMFPQAGSLTDWEMKQLWYQQPQHGIIRNADFTVIQKSDNSVVMKYNKNNIIDNYKIPVNFDLEVEYKLTSEKLSMFVRVENHEKQKGFAISPGFHPYFQAPNFSEKNVEFLDESIQQAFLKEFHLFSEEGTIQPKIPKDTVAFRVKDIGTITLSYSHDFARLWLRKQHDIDNFLCVEPTYGAPGNIVKHPIVIPPEEDYEFGMDISFEK